ncbi:DUF7146 domain-containing protein [Cupriavidus consociatus]|uniref:DUF7146 domain-containing protein n=1 Tax=Cupriavidus consociatus TaxID=2821357 RepID=UPI001AE7DD2A|nr:MULTISPECIES: primase-helicase zinc-binding domain-containing protein [unclassified Cupriavidus]MBP0624752.1 toprim domain-containing protein [Cupriavidus sp. LEh25]MDK2661468.1 primase-helicase zinc-binding domain-containing protein [Cupriavidus sp. LEh21]
MKMLSDIVKNWTPAHWDALIAQYLPADVLTDGFWRGRPGPCPICGDGTDRFTYDNKWGRGDWVCRKCDAGGPKAGDGIELVCRYTGMSYLELQRRLNGKSGEPLPAKVSDIRPACRQRSKGSASVLMRRVIKQVTSSTPVTAGDHAMRYLAARVPGLRAPLPHGLRLAVQDYWHDGSIVGRYPTMIAEYQLHDGRIATVHRTSLHPAKPEKAIVVSEDGEILPSKRNYPGALPLDGGAVRLMSPRDGAIGVAEGIENAYAAYMLFRIPTWSCLNRVLLSKFVVPDGMGIDTVHIFADFDKVDPRTGKSPGMADALALQKRLRANGFTVVLHRPKVRGTDYCDEWRTVHRLRLMSQQAIAA